MIAKIYSVRDEGTASFGPPFVMQNDTIMKRSIAELVAAEGAKPEAQRIEMMRYPADFSVFCVGSFDTETGEVSAAVPLARVAGLSDFVKQEG